MKVETSLPERATGLELLRRAEIEQFFERAFPELTARAAALSEVVGPYEIINGISMLPALPRP
jgi:hypothetical protein